MENFDLVSQHFQQEKQSIFFLFPEQPYSDNIQYTFVQKDIGKPQTLQVYLQKLKSFMTSLNI